MARRESKLIGVLDLQPLRPYGLGIDCAKDFHAICLLIPEGNQVRRWEWECLSDRASLLKAKRRISRLIKQFDCPLSYCLESTATYHYPVMRTWGGIPCIVNPALAANFKARKTDRLDAYKLAIQHLQGMWAPSFMPDANTEALRTLTRTRKRVARQRARLYNSITTRLYQWNIDIKNKTSSDKVVRACIEDIAADRFVLTDESWAMHKHTPAVVWQMLARLYEIVDKCTAEIKWLDQAITNTVVSSDEELPKRLQTIPGVGPITVATWLAEVEPASRFPTAKHLIAFCGLDPTPQISGGKQVGSRLRLGNSHIRPVLIQSASIMLNGSSKLAKSVLVKEGTRKLLICIAARKLAQLMYRVSLTGESYDESKITIEPRTRTDTTEPA